MVEFVQFQVIQVAGLIQPVQVVKILLAGFVQLGLFQKAHVVMVAKFDREVRSQDAGIWACFSPRDGKLYNTRTEVFYFVLPLYP